MAAQLLSKVTYQEPGGSFPKEEDSEDSLAKINKRWCSRRTSQGALVLKSENTLLQLGKLQSYVSQS